jgi:hypothetical protein
MTGVALLFGWSRGAVSGVIRGHGAGIIVCVLSGSFQIDIDSRS